MIDKTDWLSRRQFVQIAVAAGMTAHASGIGLLSDRYIPDPPSYLELDFSKIAIVSIDVRGHDKDMYLNFECRDKVLHGDLRSKLFCHPSYFRTPIKVIMDKDTIVHAELKSALVSKAGSIPGHVDNPDYFSLVLRYIDEWGAV